MVIAIISVCVTVGIFILASTWKLSERLTRQDDTLSSLVDRLTRVEKKIGDL